MKNFLHFFWIFPFILSIVFYTPESAHSNQSGAPQGKTGSPGDGFNTCNNCHSGPNASFEDAIEINFGDGTFEVVNDEQHELTLFLYSESEATYGFQLVAEDVNGTSVGEFILTDVSKTQLSGNYLTHTQEGSTFEDDEGVWWDVIWQAPSDFEGTVTFYAAGIIANQSGTNSGDKLLTTNYPIQVISDVVVIPGCTDPLALNYNPFATDDDASCEYETEEGIYIMGQVADVFTCDGVFLDSGGEDADFGVGENSIIHIYPGEEGGAAKIFFEEFNLGFFGVMTIRDGPDEFSPILEEALNTDFLFQSFTASENNESGCLTIQFTHNPFETAAGWKGNISCVTYGVCFGFEADVLTTFESEEGSSDASAEVNLFLGNAPFDVIWSTGETTNSISDLSQGTYSVSITDFEGCFTELSFDIIVDPEEYNMGELIDLTTCNGVLYDSGGPDDPFQANETSFIRIYPAVDGDAVKLTFEEFDIGFAATMTIYDGVGTASPILSAGFEDDFLGEVFVASQDNSSGCLTIAFESFFDFQTSPGWKASISCFDYVIYGCMDPEASNYNALAEEDGPCFYAPGCTSALFVEYFTQGFEADTDDGSCLTILEDDCTNPEALNFNPDATFNLDIDPCVFDLALWECGMHYKDERDGTSYGSVLIGENCWMTENLNYTSSETNTTPINGGVTTQLSDGFIYTGENSYNSTTNGRYYSWEAAAAAVPYSWHLPGVNELESLFFNFTAFDHQMSGSSGFNHQMSGGLTNENGLIDFLNQGSTTWIWSDNEDAEGNAMALTMIQTSMNPSFDFIPKAFGFSIRAVFGFPEGTILGCTDADYIEYNELATTDDGSCVVVAIEGCTDETALNYSSIATVDDDSCIPIIQGCMDDTYAEYNSEATVNDNSCEVLAVFGCTDMDAQNYDELANVDDATCIAHILGCTDDAFAEYNAEASLDDGSCSTTAILGCTDVSAFNYNSAANVDDNSCLPFLQGCTDLNFVEFNALANVDDGSCLVQVVLGCTIDYALNYSEAANTNDGSCQVEGCTNDLFVEYDENANIDNNTCLIFAIYGCTNDLYLEFFPPANMDDESCLTLIVMGCMEPDYIEYSADANLDDGSCENLGLLGCTDSMYVEYNFEAFVDDNTCEILIVYGCMNTTYLEFNEEVNTDDGTCTTIRIEGCTDATYLEYNMLANYDDGSCLYIVFEGCTDSLYFEFNPNANLDNGMCTTLVVFGCTDVLAFNYNELANTDDESCVPVVLGCMDVNFIEYNGFANTEDNSLCNTPVVFGCTDPEAINYNSNANTDDASCILSLLEITYIGIADGGVLFTPIVQGLGLEYELFWTFGDFSLSTDSTPTVFFPENGTYEVTLTINNASIEVTTSIFVDIINAVIGLGELSASKQIVRLTYFDLMGRAVEFERLLANQIYVKKVLYDNGSVEHQKMFKSN